MANPFAGPRGQKNPSGCQGSQIRDDCVRETAQLSGLANSSLKSCPTFPLVLPCFRPASWTIVVVVVVVAAAKITYLPAPRKDVQANSRLIHDKCALRFSSHQLQRTNSKTEREQETTLTHAGCTRTDKTTYMNFSFIISVVVFSIEICLSKKIFFRKICYLYHSAEGQDALLELNEIAVSDA